MKGEAEEEWAEGGARELVVGVGSFFRFLLAGAAGEAEAGEGPLLVAACAVGGAAAEAAEAVVAAAVGVEVAGALGLRDLRFFLAESSEEGAAGAGVEEDDAGSGRRGKKLSNIMARIATAWCLLCVGNRGTCDECVRVVNCLSLYGPKEQREKKDGKAQGSHRPQCSLPSGVYACM